MIKQNDLFVRLADCDDMLLVDSLVDSYTKENQIPIDQEITKKSLRLMQESGIVVIGENDGIPICGIAGYMFNSFFSREKVFSAMFFYVRAEHRHLTKHFLKQVEMHLLTSGIDRITMAFPSMEKNPKADNAVRFMQTIGYKILETHVHKNLNYATP